MRVVMLFAVLASCAFGLSSCGEEPKAKTEDTLVLELGGDHGSLRGALLRAGVVIVPRPNPAAANRRSMGQILGLGQAGAVSDDAGTGGPVPAPTDPAPVVPEPQSEPPPAHEPGYREVTLRPGETISHLSSLHLGTVRRYREILELNQWTEQQSRRLAAGTTVKIPIE